jgi:hypothetical protein
MVLKFVIQIDVVMQDAYKLVVRRPYIYIYIYWAILHIGKSYKQHNFSRMQLDDF